MSPEEPVTAMRFAAMKVRDLDQIQSDLLLVAL